MDLAQQLKARGSALMGVPEELANSVTHGLGLGLSLAAGWGLLASVAATCPPWFYSGCAIYVASLVAVYACSTLSHMFLDARTQRVFRRADQGSIYLLIAGSFTPFALAYLNTGWWWCLVAAMWTLSLAGFASKLLWSHRIFGVTLWLYVALGWMPAIGLWPVLEALPAQGIVLIFAGGLAYTLGTIFLTFDNRVRYFHAVWHLLVLAGSACHFAAVRYYVAPHVAAMCR